MELAGEKTNTLTIPLRCEITYYCQVRETNEFLIMTEEVSKGVLVASSINRPTNGQIPVKLLYTIKEVGIIFVRLPRG